MRNTQIPAGQAVHYRERVDHPDPIRGSFYSQERAHSAAKRLKSTCRITYSTSP
jgi:hypothetical protein